MTDSAIRYAMRSDTDDTNERFILFVLASQGDRSGLRQDIPLTLERIGDYTGFSATAIVETLERLRLQSELKYRFAYTMSGEVGILYDLLRVPLFRSRKYLR